MANKVLTLYDILNNQSDEDSTVQKAVLTQYRFMNADLAATSYWTSSHEINYLYFGNDLSSKIVSPITYHFNATGYTDYAATGYTGYEYNAPWKLNYSSSNWKMNTNGTSGPAGIGTSLLYFPDDNRCLTTAEKINLDFYFPYPSNLTASVWFGWRLSTTAASLLSYNPGSNWHVKAYFIMNNTPAISGWSNSNLSKPLITSSNYVDKFYTFAMHPTCVGYFEQTHFGNPPSGKSVYNSIYHNPYFKYEITSNSDYGFYAVPSSAQTGMANIAFIVFTDIPYSSSRSVKLQWRYYGYNPDNYSTYNKLNYADVPLSYLGQNLYNNMYIQPSGYQALTYIYYGEINASADYYWIDVVGRSWMELVGLSY